MIRQRQHGRRQHRKQGFLGDHERRFSAGLLRLRDGVSIFAVKRRRETLFFFQLKVISEL